MNASYGIIAWIVIGALAGWIGSKIMGTDAQQGGLANVLIGVSGAVIGGYLSRFFFGDDGGTNVTVRPTAPHSALERTRRPVNVARFPEAEATRWRSPRRTPGPPKKPAACSTTARTAG